MKPDSWLIVQMYFSVVTQLQTCYAQTDLERAWRFRRMTRYELRDLRERRGDGRGRMHWTLVPVPEVAAVLDPMVTDLSDLYTWLERLILLSYHGKHVENGREFTCDECYASVERLFKNCEAHALRLLELAAEHDFENAAP